jgi:uncharacterized ion transporter superfamily protein YfcC
MKLKFPHPVVILLAFVLVATILTYLIPSGEYERVIDEGTGREVVVQGSYTPVDHEPVGFFDMLLSVPKGFIARADLIVLILLVGGAFYVVDKTGTFQAGLNFLVSKFKHAKGTLLAIVGVAFATGGALNGLQEEVIAMMPVLIMLANRIGYSKVAAVGISLGCALIGGAFGPVNPFGVVIAQTLAEVTLFSGALFRMVFFLLALGFWIVYVIRTGKTETSTEEDTQMGEAIAGRHLVILLLVVLAFAISIYGIIAMGWDFNEMSGVFFAMGLSAGIIGKLGINGTAKVYSEGFAELIFAGIIVALAGSISVVINEGKIIDTMVLGLFTPLQNLPTMVSAVGMMISHIIIHVPVPSTSGQAALTMPLLTPLADLIGISRQVVVLAYQYGAGITDILTPTNGGMMAVLAAGSISYKDWFKFAWKPTLVLVGIGAVSIITAIMVNLQ